MVKKAKKGIDAEHVESCCPRCAKAIIVKLAMHRGRVVARVRPHAMATVRSRTCGAAGWFWFVHPSDEERARPWGIRLVE